jgi:antitoxin HicB
MEQFIYSAQLTMDKKDGGFMVRFVDLPEAITQADTIEEALGAASDCLEEAIANRMVMGLPIPKPSRKKKGLYPVTLSAQMAAKAALYVSLKKARISKMELARRLDCDEKEVRRLLDPHHQSKLPRIESALAVMGQKLVVGYTTKPLSMAETP